MITGVLGSGRKSTMMGEWSAAVIRLNDSARRARSSVVESSTIVQNNLSKRDRKLSDSLSGIQTSFARQYANFAVPGAERNSSFRSVLHQLKFFPWLAGIFLFSVSLFFSTTEG